MISSRLRLSVRAATTHLLVSITTAIFVGVLILKIWYPSPFDSMTTGRGLLLLIVAVDVICGPLLTLVLFDARKSKLKWRVDLFLIVSVQLVALSYGVMQAATVRPVFMAFEGDRFRVVLASDIQKDQLQSAPSSLRDIGFLGPRLIAAKISAPSDSGFLDSLQLSLAGVHPAFRPSRWQEYAAQSQAVVASLRPLTALSKSSDVNQLKLKKAVAESGIPPNSMGYLPLVNDTVTDWIVLIARDDARPLAYLNIDGW